jgi:hypothetical protein
MRLHIACLDYPEEDYQPQWITVKDQSFEDKTIQVDNHQYGNCVFLRCRFLYSGGPFAFHKCELEGNNTTLALTGAARKTEVFLEGFDEHLRKTQPLI